MVFILSCKCVHGNHILTNRTEYNKNSLKIKSWRYRDGKSTDTRFNKVYVNSTKTEQASEITMTPTLYHCTI